MVAWFLRQNLPPPFYSPPFSNANSNWKGLHLSETSVIAGVHRFLKLSILLSTSLKAFSWVSCVAYFGGSPVSSFSIDTFLILVNLTTMGFFFHDHLSIACKVVDECKATHKRIQIP